MVRQYPYTLQAQSAESAPAQDEKGNWTGGEPVWLPVSKCRDEEGSGSKVGLPDGSAYAFQFKVYMPYGTGKVPEGTLIRVVEDSGEIRVSGVVKYSRKDQLNSKLWV